MPTVLSMCHGGICRPPTRAAIDLAHGRASSYVTSAIGAIPSARWQDSHFAWKMGATSLVYVTVLVGSAASVTPATNSTAPIVKALFPSQLVSLPCIVALLSDQSLERLVRRSNCARFEC